MGNWGKTSSPSNPGGTNYITGQATQTPPPYVQSAYESLINRATGTASSGFTPYTQGFGSGQPQFDAATSALDRSMVPTYSSVNQYMSPYISSVVDATKRNMQETNAQQQQQVVGNAISKGAYGGNRVGVAQAELARQQALANNQAIADLYSKGYDTALGAAQSDKSAAQASAAGYGNLGQQAQQLNYSQYLNQQGFPYAQGSWLSSILGGIGPAAGGTTAETTPDGNIGSQLFGGLTSLFGLLSDRRAKEDVQPVGKTFDGQPIYSFRYKGEPNTQIGLIAQDVEKKHPEAVNDNGFKYVDYAKATEGAARKGHFAGGGIVPYGISDVPYSNDNELFPSYVPSVAVMHGGAGFFPTIRHRDENEGQQTMAYGGYAAPRGYASGGRPYAAFLNPDPSYVDDTGYTPYLGDGGDIISRETQGDVPFAPSAADPALAAPPVAAGTTPFDAMSYAPTDSVSPASLGDAFPVPPPYMPKDVGIGPQFETQNPEGQTLGDAWNNFTQGKRSNLSASPLVTFGSPDVNQGMMAAGFGMMASHSPFALQGIGEGGLQGIKTWQERQALERENATARSNIELQKGTLAQQARQLWLDAQKTAADIGLTQATTAGLRTTYAQSGIGWIKTVINSDGTKTITRVPFTSVPIEFGGGAQSTTPSGAESPSDADSSVGVTSGVPTIDPRDFPAQANTDVGLQSLQTQGQQLTEPAVQLAVQARTLDTSLAQLVELAKAMPESGPLIMGSGFGDRTALANLFNTTLKFAGYPPIGADELATAEGIKKLTTQLNLAVASQASTDPGIGTIMHSASASPSGETTKQGMMDIIGNLMAVNKRAQDRASYLTKWAANNYGIMQGPNGTADDYFNKEHPPREYVQYGGAMTHALNGVPITKEEYDLLPSGTVYTYTDGTQMRKP